METKKSNDEKISTLERDVVHIGDRLTHFEQSFNDRLDDLSRNIAKLFDHLGQQGKISWPLIVSLFLALFGGLSLVVGGLTVIGTLALKPGEIQVAHNTTQLAKLDLDLQREMRMLAAEGDAKRQELDTKIQIEQAAGDNLLKAQLEALTYRIEQNRTDIAIMRAEDTKHHEYFISNNAKQAEQINSIQRELARISSLKKSD